MSDYDRIWTNPTKRRRTSLKISPKRYWDVVRDVEGDLQKAAAYFCLSPSYLHRRIVEAGYDYSGWKRTHTHTNHWRGGRMDVHKDFRWVRELVLERDGYRCQCCGKDDSEGPLRDHHIIPWRLFAGTPLEHEAQLGMWNQVTLCRSCHRRQKAHYWTDFEWSRTWGLPEYQQAILRLRATALLAA